MSDQSQAVEVFSNMIGKTIVEVSGGVDDGKLVFKTKEGWTFRFEHIQDCCENVTVEDVCGDMSDLLDSPLLQAEEVSGEAPRESEFWESCTWTFYKFATIHGGVTVRWLGVSNGYYSEGVSFSEESPPLS